MARSVEPHGCAEDALKEQDFAFSSSLERAKIERPQLV
jgi:hypothetical protein